MRDDYYVYVLFDWHGTPRYVGCGHGDRAIASLDASTRNFRTADFLADTQQRLGSVPAIKTRVNCCLSTALETKVLLIAAIGREVTSSGPLVNRSPGGEGLEKHRLQSLIRRYDRRFNLHQAFGTGIGAGLRKRV